MQGEPVAAILPPPVGDDRRDGQGFAVYDTLIEPRHGPTIRVDFVEAMTSDHPGWRAISLHTVATSRGFGHSADRAAAMLAHEVKNPRSGIRGAAQLIGADELTTLIITEVESPRRRSGGCSATPRSCAIPSRASRSGYAS